MIVSDVFKETLEISKKGFEWLQNSGCSFFFLTSSIISITTSIKNKKRELANVKNDLEFQRILTEQSEQYKDEKEAEENAFKLWLTEEQRKNKREETSKKIQKDLDTMELKPFFNDWPLALTAQAVLEKCKQPASNQLTTIVGKPSGIPNGNSLLADYKQYGEMVDSVATTLKDMSIYRYNENAASDGPSLAYIYSMMSTIPSVVIMPIVNTLDKSLTIRVALWNQDSSFPYQRSVFTLDYEENRAKNDSEYLENKTKELVTHYISIAWVLNDIFMAIENGCSPTFPNYAKENSIFENYPNIKEFVNNEYSVLSYQENNDLLKECRGRINAEQIQNCMNKTIIR